jgi:hypothetical protein
MEVTPVVLRCGAAAAAFQIDDAAFRVAQRLTALGV